MLGFPQFDVPTLRERKEQERVPARSGRDRESKSDEEFDFGSVEEVEGGSVKEAKNSYRGINQSEELESAEEGGDETKKGEKFKTKTWSDVVKGLKTEDELETTNSDESGNK